MTSRTAGASGDSALVEGTPLDGPEGHAPADIITYTPNRAVVATDSDLPAYLVFSENHYPGWHASIDGAPAPIVRANGIFRAVLVPAGNHTVTFRYLPTSLRLGAAMTLAGVIAVIILFLMQSAKKPT
jgi:uncharacterized membrane protein YfhO